MRTSPTKGWPAIIWNDMQIINCSSYDCVFICSVKRSMRSCVSSERRETLKVYTTATWRHTVMQWTSREEECVSLKYERYTTSDTHRQDETSYAALNYLYVLFFLFNWRLKGLWEGSNGECFKKRAPLRKGSIYLLSSWNEMFLF